jgi:hypothetical protein
MEETIMENEITDSQKNADTGTGEANGDVKTFTEDEVKAEINRVVSKRVNAEKSKLETVLAEARKEWERESQLPEDEKKREESVRIAQELERIKQENTILNREKEATRILEEKELPSSFLNFVVDADEQRMLEKIEKLATTFDKAVESRVTDKLKGSPPEDFGGDQNQQKKKEIVTAF